MEGISRTTRCRDLKRTLPLPYSCGLPPPATVLEMECTGSGSNRILKANDASYLIPKNVDCFISNSGGVAYTRMQARFGKCEVNGVKIGRGTVVVAYSKIGITLENVLVMRWVSIFFGRIFFCSRHCTGTTWKMWWGVFSSNRVRGFILSAIRCRGREGFHT